MLFVNALETVFKGLRHDLQTSKIYCTICIIRHLRGFDKVSIKAKIIYGAVASLLALLGIGATDPQIITFVFNIGSPNSTTTVRNEASPSKNDSGNSKKVAERQSDYDFDIRIVDGVNK